MKKWLLILIAIAFVGNVACEGWFWLRDHQQRDTAKLMKGPEVAFAGGVLATLMPEQAVTRGDLYLVVQHPEDLDLETRPGGKFLKQFCDNLASQDNLIEALANGVSRPDYLVTNLAKDGSLAFQRPLAFELGQKECGDTISALPLMEEEERISRHSHDHEILANLLNWGIEIEETGVRGSEGGHEYYAALSNRRGYSRKLEGLDASALCLAVLAHISQTMLAVSSAGTVDRITNMRLEFLNTFRFGLVFFEGFQAFNVPVSNGRCGGAT